VIATSPAYWVESLTKLGQAGRILSGNPEDVESRPSPTPIDVYRRRAQLRYALVTVEAAIMLSGEYSQDSSEPAYLEGLREDLLAALWLTEILLSKQ
jgi:hypothetical protein